MKEWLTDLLSRWFIPREDYDQIQERQWQAIAHERRAEERADNAVRELYEVMDKAYSGYRGFEHYSDSAKVREFKHSEVMLPATTWGWQIRLDDHVFATIRDPKRELLRIKEYAAEQLTEKFRQHIREKLFAL